jgi:uncharacterized protein YprB with RNaseH-like and TPR domain
MSENEIRAYGQKGIFTVNQLSYTFRYRKPQKRAKHRTHPHYHSLQARSIRTGIVHVHGALSIPRAEICAYLDIEGVPERDYCYLIGVTMESGESISHHHFWADDEMDQDTIFIRFLEWLESIPTCVVYHFGSYETQALRRMQRRLPAQYQEALVRVMARTANVLSVVQRHVYFPTYSNSLKDIARALGHQWTDADSCGLQSIVWREAWERDFDLALKEKLIRYNKEDCLALKAVCDFLAEVESGCPRAESKEGCPLAVASTEDLPKPQRKWPIYGRPTFALKDLEHASQCAYFDYQRERVYVRTDKKFKRINRRSKPKRLPFTPNKKVVLECTQCPTCGNPTIRRRNRLKRKTVDIKFFESGLKKWIVAYSSWTYGCEACGNRFTSADWQAARTMYQNGLVSWCVYQNIQGRQAMYQVQESLAEVFRLHVPPHQLYVFRRWVADRYRTLYEEIRAEIIKGPLDPH